MTKKRRNKASQAEDGTVVVSFRLPADLAEALRQRAEEDDRSQNRTAVRLLRAALGAKAAS